MPYLSTRLGRWFYEEHASAVPASVTAVLLHGLFFDGRMWDGQIAALANVARVVVIDGPGHGRSDVAPPFTLEDQADALIDALDVLAIDRALLVGLSWGAMVALRVALAHPARVRALALLGGSAETESRRDIVMHRVAMAFGRHLPLPAIVARRALVPMILAPRTIREEPALVDAIVRTMQSQPIEGVARASHAVVERKRSLRPALASVRVPTLVVCGRDDQTTPVAKSVHLAEGIAGARLSLIDDCGHISALERPERVSRDLVRLVGRSSA